ncbi:LysR family transcriptional regulator [Cohnella fermenti]|uniref:LysR family transcriptional regulator n=1 Tax=Cohnella fermenti TaxID=2565925 RepID=A0A4S4C6Q6_9BACL|nr:LysR family transcriptional regulator [Cohnella fermenti]THF83523.1 LysR family transcriptional regulator [Cohnella fermenti]
MNLQQLKIFVQAIELQKLYLVAQKLDITQPTVTFHLNKLQEELGVALFHTKSYHVIKLTEAGKAFYHYARKISALASEAESMMDVYRDSAAGKLAIGSTHTPATYLLPPLLERLKSDSPKLTVHLDVRPAATIMDKIKQFELDLGVVSQTRIDDPNLIVQPMVRDDLVLIFAEGHPFAGIEQLTLEQFASHPFISHEEGSISRQLVDDWESANGIKLQRSMEVSGSEALKAAVQCRIGYGMIAEASIRTEREEGKLLSRPIPNWVSQRYIYIVQHRNKLVSPAMSAFRELLQRQFQIA